jgi:hypothetical protein
MGLPSWQASSLLTAARGIHATRKENPNMTGYTYYSEVFDNGKAQGRRDVAKLWLEKNHPVEQLLDNGFSARELRLLEAEMTLKTPMEANGISQRPA